MQSSVGMCKAFIKSFRWTVKQRRLAVQQSAAQERRPPKSLRVGGEKKKHPVAAVTPLQDSLLLWRRAAAEPKTAEQHKQVDIKEAAGEPEAQTNTCFTHQVYLLVMPAWPTTAARTCVCVCVILVFGVKCCE